MVRRSSPLSQTPQNINRELLLEPFHRLSAYVTTSLGLAYDTVFLWIES